MYATHSPAAINAAATALAYREHGFHVGISLAGNLPSVQAPAAASELTHSLAQLTGTIAEALALQLADAEDCTPQLAFSEYFTAASYAAMQSPLSHQGIGRAAIINKIKARTWAQYSVIRALAEQILDSLAELEEQACTEPQRFPAPGSIREAVGA